MSKSETPSDTEWVCAFCGNSADGADDPAVFLCCREVGHVILVDRETGDEVEERSHNFSAEQQRIIDALTEDANEH